jgi:hypothetical protein
VRTCLSREFAFLGREAAVFGGCRGRDERPAWAETRGRGNIWPKGGDISVGPYSSTAPPVMRSATMPRSCRGCATCRDVGEQPLQSGPVRDPAGEPRHRYNLETGTPNLCVLGSRASRCACSELNSPARAPRGGRGQSIKASGIAARTGRTQTCNRHDSPKPKTSLTRGGRPHNLPPAVTRANRRPRQPEKA